MKIGNYLPGLLLVAVPAFLYAGGFQVGLQGARQNGMAQTGTALTQDASSLFFNPGAVNFLDSSSHVNVGASLVFATVDFVSQDRFYTARNESKLGTPLFFYMSHRFKKHPKLSIGISINNPFGSSLKYADDWRGQYAIREISLKTFSFQPTVAYKITDQLGVGAGLCIYSGNIYLRRAIPTTDTLGNPGQALLTGISTSVGFNLGVLYKLNEKFQLGLNYRSNALLNLNNGKAEFDVPTALADSFPSTGFKSSINLPFCLSLGAAFKPNKQLTLALDVNYTGWSSYDTLKFDYETNSEPLQDTKLTKAYKNAFCFRLGAEYRVVERLTLRAGGYFDMSPVQSDYLTPETPDANRWGVTGGLSYQAAKTLGLDVAVVYTASGKRYGGSPETGFYGTYKSSALIPSFGLHILF
ncbi:MAG: outer membrane protein transport protein [Bacteroidia bacterium]|nr:outer membrane protein transport protein [Bacteroidia bacterium]